MKYKVTDKHGYLCCGVEIVKVNTSETHYHFETSKDLDLYFKACKITDWLSDGWLIEILEPEFTRDDMIKFGNMIKGLCDGNLILDNVVTKGNLDWWIANEK